MTIRSFVVRSFAAGAAVLLAGCADNAPRGNERTWRSFVEDLTDLHELSRIDERGSRVLTSYDRRGGNDDFNYFVRQSEESGWVVLADLQGPGVIRRYWTTGVDGDHPIKLYFDGEKSPRISGTFDQVFGGMAPFTPPLANYLNYCWYNYVPLTFEKSLRIETKMPPIDPMSGRRRLFFHLNVEDLPKDQPVQSFPKELAEADKAAIEHALKAWTGALEWPTVDSYPETVEIAAGATGIVFSAEGPAVLRSFDIDVAPAAADGWSQLRRNELVQDAILRVTYDNAPHPSLESTLGDFFANGWRKRHFSSLLFGSGTNGYSSRWPMPFGSSIRVEIVNGADAPIRVAFRPNVTKDRDAGDGYFHAGWVRSGPTPGTPHRFPSFRGNGKLVGTFLAVDGLGNDWWILEGDEAARVDGEAQPSWRGTGLEDYFNGGWYYRGHAFAPLHGILDRAPFRVGQYRLQLPDPFRFKTSFEMEIERGDQNVSPGYFRSVTYAYVDTPQPVPEVPRDRASRRDTDHQYFRHTMMLQLSELERANDFVGAADLLREYIERFPGAVENGIWELRILEYRRLLGEDIPLTAFDPFIAGEKGPEVIEQAKLLKWFYEGENRALFAVNANGRFQAFFNAQKLLEGDHPYNVFVAGVELPQGKNTVAAEVEMLRQEPWLQMAVRTHKGLVGTGPDTPCTRIPSIGWNQPGSSTAGWTKPGMPNLPRGTPDAPMIGGVPSPFVLVNSKAYSVRFPQWAMHQGKAYFRIDFDSGVTGWPDFASRVTGLAR